MAFAQSCRHQTGRPVYTVISRTAIQRDPNRLEEWAKISLDTCEVLHLGRKIWYKLVSSSVGKALALWQTARCTWASGSREGQSYLGWINRSTASKTSDYFPLLSTYKCIWNTLSNLRPSKTILPKTNRSSAEATKTVRAGTSVLGGETEDQAYLAWRRDSIRGHDNSPRSHPPHQYLWESHRGDRSKLCTVGHVGGQETMNTSWDMRGSDRI